MIHSFIITGFLGAGKSTLLTDTIKKHFTDKKIALIVNEFGQIGVDQNILKNVHSDVIEISDGCICCQMAEEFESGVIEIINKYNPEIIFVETAGITEPFPIFMCIQSLGVAVDGVICVCDVKNYASYMHNATAKSQVGGANIIILNKTDLVNDEELAHAKEEIIAYKEANNITNTFTGETVFNHYMVHTAEQGIVPKEVFEGMYQLDEIVGLAKDYQHHDHISHDAIDRRIAQIHHDIMFQDIDALLEALPTNIYRVKGMVKTNDVPTPLVVNHSFGNSSFEELTDYQGDSILVFIGRDIDEDMMVLSDQFDFLHLIQGDYGSHPHH